MTILKDLGCVFTETKAKTHAILIDEGTQKLYEGGRFCYDGSECQIVYFEGGKTVVSGSFVTNNPDCKESGNLVNCTAP